MYGFLTRFGSLVHTLVAPHFGVAAPALHLDLSFTGLLSLFAPELSWFTFVQLGIAGGLVLRQALALNRRWRVRLTRERVDVLAGGKLQASFQRHQLGLPVLLSAPLPSVVLVDERMRAVALDFVTLGEARDCAAAVAHAMHRFEESL